MRPPDQKFAESGCARRRSDGERGESSGPTSTQRLSLSAEPLRIGCWLEREAGLAQTGGRPAEPATLCLGRTRAPTNCQGTKFGILGESSGKTQAGAGFLGTYCRPEETANCYPGRFRCPGSAILDPLAPSKVVISSRPAFSPHSRHSAGVFLGAKPSPGVVARRAPAWAMCRRCCRSPAPGPRSCRRIS